MSDEDASPELSLGDESAESTSFRELVNDDGSFIEGWQSHLTGEYEAAAATAANYKTLPELAKAVFHKQQSLSQRDDRVTVPNGSATPDEVARYRQAIGIPATAEEYRVNRPDAVPEEAWDADLAQTFAGIFHENNIPPAAAQALVERHAEMEQARADSAAAAQEAQRAESLEALRSKFGQDFTKQLDYARRMAITAGVDPNDDGFNSPAVVEALAYAGRNMREDFMVQSSDTAGASTSAALATKIMEDKEHPEYEKFWADDPATRKKVNDLLARAPGRLI